MIISSNENITKKDKIESFSPIRNRSSMISDDVKTTKHNRLTVKQKILVKSSVTSVVIIGMIICVIAPVYVYVIKQSDQQCK